MKNINVKFVLGTSEILFAMEEQKPLEIFAKETLNFLDALSKTIRQQKELYLYSDLAALGFWCRRSHMQQEGEKYAIRIGKGISFQVVPSNIPLLFMYSMIAALLAGNCVVMRLPAKSSPQEDIVVRCLQDVLEGMPFFKNRIVLLRYGHEKEYTDMLSQLCDVRVIWGGDKSVAAIQESPLREGITDIAFVDRKSAAVLVAKEVFSCKNIKSLVHEFYNDTYLNDQNACSSPSVICWIGNDADVEAAKKIFWSELDTLVKERYNLPSNAAVKKWEMALKTAAQQTDIHIIHKDNRIVCVDTRKLWINWWEDTMHCGYFIQYRGEDISAIEPLVVPKCQTLTYFGAEPQAIWDYKKQKNLNGIDRVVPVGHALDFQLVWDGIDLIDEMSKRI